MAKQIGIDFGSSMIKAACTEGAWHDTNLLSLSDDSLFFPAAIQLTTPQGQFDAGWTAYGNRRSHGYQVAVQFRDRVLSLENNLTIAGQQFNGVALLTILLTKVGEELQQRFNDITALALAIPDHWTESTWSFPIAVQKAGWMPKLFAREWCCVLATRELSDQDDAMLLSLGSSGLRATLCRKSHSNWRPIHSTFEPSCSGAALHRSVADQVARDIIEETRYDPRDTPDTDQALYDGVDAAIWDLCCVSNSMLHFPKLGLPNPRPLTRDHLRQLMPGFQSTVQQFVQNILGHSDVNLSTCPIIAWGELTMLFPIQDWLGQFCPTGQTVQIVPLGTVAEGIARLCAHASENAFALSADITGSCCPNCGSFSNNWIGETCLQCRSNVIPLLQGLPCHISTSAPSEARLVLMAEDQQAVPIQSSFFKLGRNPKSDWPFDMDRFPTVSAAHAVIVHEGSRYVIRDLNSKNGTYVNGQQIDEKTLQHGDEINLGLEGPRLRFDAPIV